MNKKRRKEKWNKKAFLLKSWSSLQNSGSFVVLFPPDSKANKGVKKVQ